MKHFAIEYAKRINDVLHSYLTSTWFYKHQIYEVPGICTALFITYDDQDEDEFEIFENTSWDTFLERLSVVKSEWNDLTLQTMKKFAKKPKKTMGGWEGRTIYIIKGGNYPKFWEVEKADEDIKTIFLASWSIWGTIIEEEAKRVKQLIPVGREHYIDYEHFVRVVINFLFRICPPIFLPLYGLFSASITVE